MLLSRICSVCITKDIYNLTSRISLCPVCVCDWDLVVCVLQVQNISQSMEVLDLRTYRDLQYVRNTEGLMKVVDGKLKVASDNPRGLNPKGFQVIVSLSPPVRRVCVRYCRVSAGGH